MARKPNKRALERQAFHLERKRAEYCAARTLIRRAALRLRLFLAWLLDKVEAYEVRAPRIYFLELN